MSPDLQGALAKVVAAPEDTRALLILEDNRSGGFKDLVEALACEPPVFAVSPAPYLLALDVDAGASSDAIDALIEVLRKEGLDPVVLRSGTEMNRHVFCYITNTALLENVVLLAKEANADVRNNQRIRPPGTPHRSGALPQLLSHESWEQALESLAASRPPDAVLSEAVTKQAREKLNQSAPPTSPPPASSSTRPTPSMSKALETLIRFGHKKKEYINKKSGNLDDSALLLAICNIAVREEYPVELLWDTLQRPWNNGGASVRKRIEHKSVEVARKHFDVTIKTARSTSRINRRSIESRADAKQTVEAIERVVRALPWPGHSGRYQRAVMVGICQIARSVHSVTPRLAVRAVAEEAGVSRRTAASHIKALEAAGWVDKRGPSNEVRGCCYKLLIPLQFQTPDVAHLLEGTIFALQQNTQDDSSALLDPQDELRATTYPVLASHGGRGSGANLRAALQTINPGSDAFAHRGLGKGAWAALEAVLTGCRDTSEVAQAIGVCDGTARRNIKVLIDAGLVTRVDGFLETRSEYVLPAELESVAVSCGSSGVSEKRSMCHQRERAGYRSFCAHRSAAKAAERAATSTQPSSSTHVPSTTTQPAATLNTAPSTRQSHAAYVTDSGDPGRSTS